MFEDPMQWLIIGVIVVVIFLWGPQKIPDLAKALGRARREFDSASKEMNAAMTMTPAQAVTQVAAQATMPKQTVEVTGDQMLINTAKQLGINTEGKTREQISQEILNRVKPQA
jgi:sec-independent protein translocase protein TatA